MTEQQQLDAQSLSKQIKWSEDGLVPAIVQDAQSKEVLMLAYMNEESLKLSVESGTTWFWSRSRNELWNKGATSGHTQQIRSMSYDCDGDTLLVKVNQAGPACHTGSYSCFFNPIDVQGAVASTASEEADRFSILGDIEGVIAQRYAERPEGAYTTYLFEKGLDKILKKVGEEATEAIIAAKNGDNDELRSESSDLIFHLLVLLRERGLPLDDVMSELKDRHGKPASNNAMRREQAGGK
ncbi:bifunctional phosphoribosyl-AMP cyclohydrolase/phosphoribosyl-ATP diphosphatase HisIE [Paenibacillus sp. NEAU-GSW1]|uniref:bifunctional phosphoribosyl-AMP cyclohydrolase/phosphoribosyl-ATP diphosphatase HisIE n=1 Tax=Paenibacillus sp. NEAU-GSW1 TaxID=2682486 RepID=UPI0012E1BCCC|nr:bifunctional phosphoribosyl-AMP cyclohydrolase/phosphoribosyl-ATP diphosphatase HisIE [Paenibacillus sp. NEAU-GSW1]MUT64952.1 bifunctional phosphoribosyl-AMP cyclohydrolase/phosphoribosyl-ATP diphosphatase HisIE [Paenibacillus sp. NEAU-GSW1]